MKTITLEDGTLTLQISKYERKRRDQERRTIMAKSLLVALVAEGKQQDYELRAFCGQALSLGGDDLTAGIISHSAARNRLDLGANGLEPVAGCYPMTEYEHQLQAELVQEVDDMSVTARRHMPSQQFAHLILPSVEAERAIADVSTATS